MSSRNARRRNARNSQNKTDVVSNSLTGLVDGLNAANQMGLLTGGSTLSSYGTMGWSTNYTLLTLNQIMLSYFYTSNGIFQTAIQLPIQDALSKGIEIESDELSAGDIDELLDYWEDIDMMGTLLDYQSWVRLFGGGAIIINTNDDPEKPLNYKRLNKTDIEYYAVDRWELTVMPNLNDLVSSMTSLPESEYYYLYGKKIHSSRVILGSGKRAPSRIRRTLSGWGMSEGERMIRDLNLYLKTQDVLYEILDEAKVDVFKIKGFNQKLINNAGTSSITNRVQMANELKNYLNALVMDVDDEWDQKTLAFSGLAEVSNENRIGVAAALRMPMVKLFGLSPSGFSNGETDMDNYNQMVEGEIRRPMKSVIRKLMKIASLHLWGYAPDLRVKYPPMKDVDPEKEEAIKASKTMRLLATYDRALIDSEEFGKEAEKQGLIDTKIKAAIGMLDKFPIPPNGAESVSQIDLPAEQKVKVSKSLKAE